MHGWGNFTVEINKIAREDWATCLDSFRDSSLYQCWEYADVHWSYARRDHVVFRKDGLAVGMAQVIIIKLPLIRIAYIPWGPIWKRRDAPVDDFLFGLVIKSLKEEYVDGQKMTLRIRPYGFEESDSSLNRILMESGFARIHEIQRSRSRTILVDLESSEIDLRKRLAKNWRNSLNYSEKKNLVIRESFDEESLRLVEPLYEALKKKKNFKGVNLSELATIQVRLGPGQKMRTTLCEYQGMTISASVCSGIGDTALGLVAVTSEEGRRRRAYYLLQWDEILWAKRNSYKTYDLNGINPALNPRVYHFKSGIKGNEVTFLGVYDCYPNWTAKPLVNLSNLAVRHIGKGNVKKIIKKIGFDGH